MPPEKEIAVEVPEDYSADRLLIVKLACLSVACFRFACASFYMGKVTESRSQLLKLALVKPGSNTLASESCFAKQCPL